MRTRVMNLLALAKERCANWNDSNDACLGWSVEFLRDHRGPVQPRDHCRLKEGEACEYFERCVLAKMAKKEDPEAFFHYRSELRRLSLKTESQVIENKRAKTGKTEGSLPTGQKPKMVVLSPLERKNGGKR